MFCLPKNFENWSQTYWQSFSQLTHRLGQLTQDSGQRFLPRIFTTHNLLVKNECKISSSQIPHSQKKLPEVRQVWGDFWNEARNIWRGFGKTSHEAIQNLSKLSPNFIQVLSGQNCTQKSASPAVVPRGCDRRKNLVRGCVTPPWNDQKLSDISFINPLRFAPIAYATTGLIQAMILHSDESLLRGDSV